MSLTLLLLDIVLEQFFRFLDALFIQITFGLINFDKH